MMKLKVDLKLAESCRELARRIAAGVEAETQPYTTVSIERAILRLLGLEGADADGVPLANRVVDALGDRIADGAAFALGSVMAEAQCGVPEAARRILAHEKGHEKGTGLFRKGGSGKGTGPCQKGTCQKGTGPFQKGTGPDSEASGSSDSDSSSSASRPERWLEAVATAARAGARRVSEVRRRRAELMRVLPAGESPWFYVIVATGNIYEDAVQAQAAARQGAQVIAVIRSTAQSLLDYVPEGATTEGFAGTFATQENFRIMRRALDEVGEELGRYVLLCNYCSGLCMPEIAALGALERLDMMLNDALYGIIFRDINMRRTLTDQFFSRRINGFAGIIINTGEDNYLKTDEGLRAAHTVLASQFINHELALVAGVPVGQIGLGHAFELDPEIEDGFLWELAQALLSRTLFPENPLKYMPPTRYKSGDIFRGYLQDGLFNIVSQMTGQRVQLLGMLSEAAQTPGVHDRHLALRGADYVRRNLRHLGDELQVRPGGRLERRADQVLREAHALLERIASGSLLDALESGVFAGIARPRAGGRGLGGVVAKSAHYINPFQTLLEADHAPLEK